MWSCDQNLVTLVYPTFVEVTGEELVGETPSILNRIKEYFKHVVLKILKELCAK